MLVCKNKSRRTIRIHRLVADAFVSNPNNKPQVNHIDNNGENNFVDNLEWCTSAENTAHSTKQGRNTHNNINGNLKQSEEAMVNRQNMVGNKYGKWVVLKNIEKEYTAKTISKMLCRCACGKEKQVDMISLKKGRSTQCMSCAGKFSGRKKKNENTI